MPLCPKCRHENPVEAQFCGACGSAIMQTCSRCARSNPPEAIFCGSCGNKLTTEPPRRAPAKPAFPAAVTGGSAARAPADSALGLLRGKQAIAAALGVAVVLTVATGLLLTRARQYPLAAGIGRNDAHGRVDAERQQCLNNLKQIGVALTMYARDYDDRFPPSENWVEAVSPYIERRETFLCPSRPGVSVGYALNANIAGKRLGDIRDATEAVLAFESDAGGSHPADVGTSYADPRSHEGGNHLLRADGSARWVNDKPGGERAWVTYLLPEEIAKQKVREAVSSARTLSGAASTAGGETWPFRLRFTAYDTTSGHVAGEMEWTTLATITRIEGALREAALSFRETEYIRRGRAIIGPTYALSPSPDSVTKIKGTWRNPQSGNGGTVWCDLTGAAADGAEIAPQTRRVKLTEADLAGKSAWELDLLRNEMYARHGYVFGRQDLSDYFNSKTWYRPDTDDQQRVWQRLSPIEQYNVGFIREYQEKNGLTRPAPGD